MYRHIISRVIIETSTKECYVIVILRINKARLIINLYSIVKYQDKTVDVISANFSIIITIIIIFQILTFTFFMYSLVCVLIREIVKLL